jgi:hypothetical protein
MNIRREMDIERALVVPTPVFYTIWAGGETGERGFQADLDLNRQSTLSSAPLRHSTQRICP